MVTPKNRKFIKCEKNDSAKTNGFYNNSNVIRIECEGERQKYSKYIFRVFRFLSPTKLNRNELAGYSKAHSIQPLCLAGVVRLWTYTSFEALKVRDFGSNRCNVTAIIKISVKIRSNPIA